MQAGCMDVLVLLRLPVVVLVAVAMLLLGRMQAACIQVMVVMPMLHVVHVVLVATPAYVHTLLWLPVVVLVARLGWLCVLSMWCGCGV